MSKFCTECGTKNEDESKFCANCGEPFEVNEENSENSELRERTALLFRLPDSIPTDCILDGGAKLVAVACGDWMIPQNICDMIINAEESKEPLIFFWQRMILDSGEEINVITKDVSTVVCIIDMDNGKKRLVLSNDYVAEDDDELIVNKLITPPEEEIKAMTVDDYLTITRSLD